MLADAGVGLGEAEAAGDQAATERLPSASEEVIRSQPRLGAAGAGLPDVQIAALRGDRARALAALREAIELGWRDPGWRYYRDADPNLASIRDAPEFKSAFSALETCGVNAQRLRPLTDADV